MAKKIYQIATLKKSDENIKKLWHDIKVKDINSISNVWQDDSGRKMIDKLKKTERIINRISNELKAITDILDNDKKEGEKKDEIK